MGPGQGWLLSRAAGSLVPSSDEGCTGWFGRARAPPPLLSARLGGPRWGQGDAETEHPAAPPAAGAGAGAPEAPARQKRAARGSSNKCTPPLPPHSPACLGPRVHALIVAARRLLHGGRQGSMPARRPLWGGLQCPPPPRPLRPAAAGPCRARLPPPPSHECQVLFRQSLGWASELEGPAWSRGLDAGSSFAAIPPAPALPSLTRAAARGKKTPSPSPSPSLPPVAKLHPSPLRLAPMVPSLPAGRKRPRFREARAGGCWRLQVPEGQWEKYLSRSAPVGHGPICHLLVPVGHRRLGRDAPMV